MGRVYRTLKIRGVKDSVEARALFDTGASRTFMQVEVAGKIGYSKFPELRDVSTAAKGRRLRVVGM